MGSAQFNQDLAASKKLAINGVSKIRRGDSDGEVVFTWSPNDDTPPLDIQILILDVDSYPRGSSVLIFTASEHSFPDLSSRLERLSASLAGKSISTIIETVAEKLLTKLEASANAGESAIVDSEEDDEWESDYEEYSDDLFEIPRASSKPRAANVDETAGSATRLKTELRIAQAAGISIGILPRKSVLDAEFFSLSLRVKKLGIPEHALEAWGLERCEYLVLLCRFPNSHPPISKLMDSESDDYKLQCRFGKCSKPKPSLDTARLAFTAPSDGALENQVAPCKEAKDDNGSFIHLYVSNSINMLMNNHFMTLLKARRRDGLSWDAALRLLQPDSGSSSSPPATKTDAGASKASKASKASEASEAPVSENAIPSLRHDYALNAEDKFSLPMAAMQFALRHLARCTKYCMVCHQRVEDGFEALKPYVCSNSLCNYQFLNLGLGASIEHEIISNPYVVDILISFFAVALATPNGLRNFPAGLNIRSVFTGNKSQDATRLAAEACFFDKTIRFGPDLKKTDPSLKVGDRLMIVVNTSYTLPVPTILDGNYERHVCKVTDISVDIYTFEVIATFTGPLKSGGVPQEQAPTQLSMAKKGWVNVMILRYQSEIDRLNEADRSIALAMVLHEIPSVLEMRKFLLKNPGQRLTSWSRLEKPALTLLQWIISSNRSLILQNDAVPRPQDSSQTYLPKPDPNPNRVEGIPPHWMQFRFLQGTPERERIFTREIATLSSESKKNMAIFPTIFAWHGSSLQNWHSIIRTGLDFNKVINGRSFGDGVYLSNNFQVSLAYCRRGASVKMTGPPPVTYWPNSVLKPSSAISICEVVNRCDKFVATTPHYVVKQIEWIQCRYLFVCVEPNAEALQNPFPTKPREPCSGYVDQQPTKKILASLRPNQEVKIPLSAVPSNRRHLGQSGEGAVDGSELDQTQQTEAESLDSDHGETDHELLVDSEDDESAAVRSNKRRSSSIDSADQRRPKLNSSEYSKKMSKEKENAAVSFETDFVPGSLDLDSLPRLPEPSWASTSPMAIRTLNRSIKELHDIQSKEDTASLGWYINFDKLDNVFHWTVEMHSFDPDLPLAKDMKERGCTSIVLEFRFGSNFPYSPPFVRVIRPRFLPFMRGGGGHVTAGGAICSEMLTNSGWSAVMTIEKVLLQIRLGLTEMDPPARLETMKGMLNTRDYGIGEAIDAYQRAAAAHGWQVPKDLKSIGSAWTAGEQKKGK